MVTGRSHTKSSLMYSACTYARVSVRGMAMNNGRPVRVHKIINAVPGRRRSFIMSLLALTFGRMNSTRAQTADRPGRDGSDSEKCWLARCALLCSQRM
jgi:hypothetical protein